MFIILLKFADKAKAPSLMAGHNTWLQRGFEEGLLLLAGTVKPAAGGALIAHGATREAIEAFVAHDPFVAEGVVTAEILDITPARTDTRLAFLKD
ncbi:YciI family protein [Sphingomonas sp.]|jgi:uncharacterized protein YciI|uniref:YciI family protein n=1 Tax=Sphingomonas sp. TaxID=28214 RepID=UPI0035C7F02F